MAIDGLMAFPAGSSAEPGPAPVVPDDLISLFFPTPDISYQGLPDRPRTRSAPGGHLRPAGVPVLVGRALHAVARIGGTELDPASISSTGAEIGEDGAVRIVVAERDPGVAN